MLIITFNFLNLKKKCKVKNKHEKNNFENDINFATTQKEKQIERKKIKVDRLFRD